jgi:5-methylcytosine-specific restriction endonuclease McrA
LTENPLCTVCQEEGLITIATEVDHRVKHQGNEALFWDRANLQGLCVTHHGAKTARGE